MKNRDNLQSQFNEQNKIRLDIKTEEKKTRNHAHTHI